MLRDENVHLSKGAQQLYIDVRSCGPVLPLFVTFKSS